MGAESTSRDQRASRSTATRTSTSARSTGRPGGQLHPDEVVERNDGDLYAVQVDDERPLAHLIPPRGPLRLGEQVQFAVLGEERRHDGCEGELLGARSCEPVAEPSITIA